MKTRWSTIHGFPRAKHGTQGIETAEKSCEYNSVQIISHLPSVVQPDLTCFRRS